MRRSGKNVQFVYYGGIRQYHSLWVNFIKNRDNSTAREREEWQKGKKYTLVLVAFTLFILAVLGLILLFYYFRVLTISELLVHQSNVAYINVALRIILWIFVMVWFNRLALVCKVTASHDNVSLGKYQ